MASTIYVAHRENQRELILEVAEDLFIEKGILEVSIGDIADASRLTRATIYKYFANKEEMAQEIFKLITLTWVERDEREVWSLGGTGFERIERFITSHFQYLFTHKREARFIAEFNYLYAKEWTVETAMKLFDESLAGERKLLFTSVQQGQVDGSLNAEITAELMLAMIFNFNSGMMSRLGELGDKVQGEYGLSMQLIFEQISRAFLEGLKAR